VNENDPMTEDEVAAVCGKTVDGVKAHLGADGFPTTMRSSDRRVYVRRGDLFTWRELADAENEA
jgi:hypothetical protein